MQQIEHKNYHWVSDPLAASRDFYTLLAKRRTIRRFSDKPVDRNVIEQCILAAGTAPNGANLQPWKFVAVACSATKKRIRAEAERIEADFYGRRAPETWLRDLEQLGTNSSKPHIEEAPYLVTIFSEMRRSEQLATYYPVESTGIATGFLIAALHHAGLATLTHTPSPMRFLNEVLNVDKRFRAFLLLAVGYPKEPVMVPDIQKKTLEEIAIFR